MPDGEVQLVGLPSIEDYLARARELVDYYVQQGYWSPEAARNALSTIYQQVTTQGLQPSTYMYKQVTEYHGDWLKAQAQAQATWGKEQTARAQTRQLEEFREAERFQRMVAGAVAPKEEELGQEYMVKVWGQRGRPGQTYQEWLNTEEAKGLQRQLGFQIVREPAREREPLFQPPSTGEGLTAGGRPWKDWFERQYPSIMREWRQLEGEGVPAKERQATWARLLEDERVRLREKFASYSPYERGERPSAFAPKIKMVGF